MVPRNGLSPLTEMSGAFFYPEPPPVHIKILTKEVISMKFSHKIQQCGLSPMRKFYPYEVAAEAKGLRGDHLNIV